MVVFKRSNLTEDLIQGEVPDTLYGLSKNGWMDGDLLNQARAGRTPGFLKLILCGLSVCVRVCVCPRPRLLITSGVI